MSIINNFKNLLQNFGKNVNIKKVTYFKPHQNNFCAVKSICTALNDFQVRIVRVQSFALSKQAAAICKNKTDLYILRSTLRRKNTMCRNNMQKTIRLCRICGLFYQGWKYVSGEMGKIGSDFHTNNEIIIKIINQIQ